MRIKDFANKIGDFGTKPYIYIQKSGSIIGGGKPDEVCKRFGEMKVYSFIAANRGQIKIFIK